MVQSGAVQLVALLEEVGIDDPAARIDSVPEHLSGGQQQRAMIALALSCNPKLLIADEPTTALDVTVQAQVLEVIRRLHDQRAMSVIFISHDLGVIGEIADDVAVMLNGKNVECGSVRTVFDKPRHPYTRGLLNCRPRLDREFRRLPTIGDYMESRTVDGRVEIVEKKVDVRQLEQRLARGRGRLLHPQAELEAMGYPWDEAHWPADTAAVDADQQPLLDVRGLKVHFPIRKGLLLRRTVGHVRAVEDVSFKVYPGQTLGLVGESGCGKTTTARSILQLIRADAGTVMFGATNLSSLTAGEMRLMRRRMQIVFQDSYGSMNPRMTVEQIVSEPMSVHGIGASRRGRRDRVVNLLDEVGLTAEHLDRCREELSGGQRQRVAIARALALNPELLICDEIVSALDTSIQAQVLNLLKDLQERHALTCIFISHDLAVVKFMADMLAVMKYGKIVEFGPSDSVYMNPHDEYTSKLIDAMPKGHL